MEQQRVQIEPQQAQMEQQKFQLEQQNEEGRQQMQVFWKHFEILVVVRYQHQIKKQPLQMHLLCQVLVHLIQLPS